VKFEYWMYNKSLKTLTHCSTGYYINLGKIHNSAELCDWIFQIVNKSWVTNCVIGDLLRALDYIFRPQETFCSLGYDKHSPKEGMDNPL
jgi:hypothetical protein